MDQALDKSFRYDVFISYSSKDKPVITTLIKDLKKENITYWVDTEQINFGDSINEKITEGLETSNYVIPCVSRNLKISGWTRAEYGSILCSEFSGNSNRRVIPLLLEDCDVNDIPTLLRDKKRVSYSNKTEFNEFINFLKNRQCEQKEDEDSLKNENEDLWSQREEAEIKKKEEEKKEKKQREDVKNAQEAKSAVSSSSEKVPSKELKGSSSKGLIVSVCFFLGLFLLIVVPPLVHNEPFINETGINKTDQTNSLQNSNLTQNSSQASETVQTPSNNLDTYTNSIGMEFVKIPIGEFEMGSFSGEVGRSGDEDPVHKVTLSKSYYLGKYEVTQKQWKSVMGGNPSNFYGDDFPVDDVSWYDVQEFIKKLNQIEGTDKYSLPSEAEWEYACRAGTSTSHFFGDDNSKLGDYAWYSENSGSHTHPVGQKKPNPWGLYDIYGNVWEWCQDMYYDNYNNAPINGSTWDNSTSLYRVRRGGGLDSSDVRLRSANRGKHAPENHLFNLGFRLVKDV